MGLGQREGPQPLRAQVRGLGEQLLGLEEHPWVRAVGG